MSDNISEDQLIHYFAGECSEEEAAEIKAWINADPVRRQRVRQLFRAWEAARHQSSEGRDVEEMWNNLERRLGFSSRKRVEGTRRQTDEARRGSRSGYRYPSSRRFYRSTTFATALVVALVALAWVLTERPDFTGEGSNMRKIETGPSQRAKVELEGGTRVTLHAESELAIPSDFRDDSRVVSLKGQAFLEVVPDEDMPFSVRADGAVMEVLGTRFNIGAYPNDDSVRVAVAEGEVAVEPDRNATGNRVRVTERQMASVSKKTSTVVHREEINLSKYVAWVKGQLVFEDAAFPEVVRRLRHWYGVDVELVGNSNAVDRLNATFDEEPLGEVLPIIAETLNLQYEKKKETVKFFVRE